jgi:tRNA pseudouridine38-40 synthase
LEGRHDFKAFCASRSSARSTLRTIKKIEITRSPYFYPSPGSPKDNSLIVIDIEAEGFLYNMARNIVGNLIEAGRGKNIDMRKVLLSKERKAAGPCAPARGLCLMRVNY